MSTTLHEYEREKGVDQAEYDYWAQTRKKIVESWMPETELESILDIGCGSGYLADHLGADGTFVFGIDQDEESIRIAAQRSDLDLALIGDATTLPFKANTFDCILLGDVIEHFDHSLPILTETNRVLRQDGTLIVSVPAFRWLWGPHDEHNNHVDRYNISRLSETVSKAGFLLEEYRYTNSLPLPIYFILQRVIRSGVPSYARGEHSRVLKFIKNLLISIEVKIEFPVGVTLLSRFSKRDSAV